MLNNFSDPVKQKLVEKKFNRTTTSGVRGSRNSFSKVGDYNDVGQDFICLVLREYTISSIHSDTE